MVEIIGFLLSLLTLIVVGRDCEARNKKQFDNDLGF